MNLCHILLFSYDSTRIYFHWKWIMILTLFVRFHHIKWIHSIWGNLFIFCAITFECLLEISFHFSWIQQVSIQWNQKKVFFFEVSSIENNFKYEIFSRIWYLYKNSGVNKTFKFFHLIKECLSCFLQLTFFRIKFSIKIFGLTKWIERWIFVCYDVVCTLQNISAIRQTFFIQHFVWESSASSLCHNRCVVWTFSSHWLTRRCFSQPKKK